MTAAAQGLPRSLAAEAWNRGKDILAPITSCRCDFVRIRAFALTDPQARFVIVYLFRIEPVVAWRRSHRRPR
jgi:hypothetical protein